MSAIITLTGRLGPEPEIRFAGNGMPVCKLSIVTSRRVKDQTSGEWSDADTTWWDCTAFKSLAENIASSLGKGMAVIATGRVVQETWDDKQTGAKRSRLVVKLDSIGPDLTRATATVEKANSQAQGGQQGGQQQRPAAQQDGWSAPAGQPQGGQGGWGAPQGQQGGYSDSPPF